MVWPSRYVILISTPWLLHLSQISQHTTVWEIQEWGNSMHGLRECVIDFTKVHLDNLIHVSNSLILYKAILIINCDPAEFNLSLPWSGGKSINVRYKTKNELQISLPCLMIYFRNIVTSVSQWYNNGVAKYYQETIHYPQWWNFFHFALHLVQWTQAHITMNICNLDERVHMLKCPAKINLCTKWYPCHEIIFIYIIYML